MECPILKFIPWFQDTAPTGAGSESAEACEVDSPINGESTDGATAKSADDTDGADLGEETKVAEEGEEKGEDEEMEDSDYDEDDTVSLMVHLDLNYWSIFSGFIHFTRMNIEHRTMLKFDIVYVGGGLGGRGRGWKRRVVRRREWRRSACRLRWKRRVWKWDHCLRGSSKGGGYNCC